MPVIDLVPPREWPTLGPQVVDWMESRLCHGPGDVHGEPLFLDEEWVQFIYDCYRIYPKGHRREGRRVVGYAVASMPKGRAKSEVAGALVCAEAKGPVRFDGWNDDGTPRAKRVRDPLIRCLATEEGQTGNTYKNVMVMLAHAAERFPDEFDDVNIGSTRVLLGPGGVDGEIRPCTAGAASKDGGKETFAVADEVHLYYLPELIEMHNLVRQNCQKRKIAEPWMLATTTMFSPGQQSVAETLYDEADKLDATKRKQHGFCFHHRQGTISEDDWDDDDAQIASLAEAYGPGGYYQDFEQKLEFDIRAPGKPVAESARYWHNIRWTGEGKAVNVDKWDALADPARTPTGGERILVAFDGSDRGAHADDTVLVGWLVAEVPHLFLIERWRRPQHAGPEYRVPRAQVRDRVTEVEEEFDIARMVCDPPGWQDQIDAWDIQLGNGPDGKPRVVVFDTFVPARMGPAIDRFIEAVDEGRFTHDGSPELREYALNAVLTQAKGRSRFHALAKPKEHAKIDGLVAATFGYDELHDIPVDDHGPAEFISL